MEDGELGQDRDRHSEQQQEYSQHPSDPSNDFKERSKTQNYFPVDDEDNQSEKVSPPHQDFNDPRAYQKMIEECKSELDITENGMEANK